MLRGSSERQKDLFTQLAEARTPEERDRIVRRMRHAEVGQEGERGRVLDGLIVNGRDPYADLRGGARPVYESDPTGDTAGEGTERPMTHAITETMPRDVEQVLDVAPGPAAGRAVTCRECGAVSPLLAAIGWAFGDDGIWCCPICHMGHSSHMRVHRERLVSRQAQHRDAPTS